MYAYSGIVPTVLTTAIGANATNLALHAPVHVSAAGSLNIAVRINFSAVTVAAGITLTLQTIDDSTSGTWVAAKTVTLVNAQSGDYYIKLLAARTADQTYLPLLPAVRVVATSGGGDSATLVSVVFFQGL